MLPNEGQRHAVVIMAGDGEDMARATRLCILLSAVLKPDCPAAEGRGVGRCLCMCISIHTLCLLLF